MTTKEWKDRIEAAIRTVEAVDADPSRIRIDVIVNVRRENGYWDRRAEIGEAIEEELRRTPTRWPRLALGRLRAALNREAAAAVPAAEKEAAMLRGLATRLRQAVGQ